MFGHAHLSFFYTLFSLSVLAAAMPGGSPPTETVTVTAPASTETTVSQCNTGSIQCCNQVVSSTSAEADLLLGLLGVVLDGVDVLLGLDCSPISVVGIANGACSAAPVCCENNSIGGLINVGCVPIIL